MADDVLHRPLLAAAGRRPLVVGQGLQHAEQALALATQRCRRITEAVDGHYRRPVVERRQLHRAMMARMTRLGYQIPNFTYPGVDQGGLFDAVAAQAKAADRS